MNGQQIEQEIQDKGKTAPRVTPQHIENIIRSEHYFTAADGDAKALENAAFSTGALDASASRQVPIQLGLLTFCVLVLNNGFTVTGESACASPDNFDADIGRKIARKNAVEKIWSLEGYLLREKLAKADTKTCPHAAPFYYCETCVADPCPLGLGKN